MVVAKDFAPAKIFTNRHFGSQTYAAEKAHTQKNNNNIWGLNRKSNSSRVSLVLFAFVIVCNVG